MKRLFAAFGLLTGLTVWAQSGKVDVESPREWNKTNIVFEVPMTSTNYTIELAWTPKLRASATTPQVIRQRTNGFTVFIPLSNIYSITQLVWTVKEP